MATTLARGLPMPGDDLQGYLQAVNAFPLLSAEEEIELAERYRRERDIEAAWRLVASHLRYVVKVDVAISDTVCLTRISSRKATSA